MNTLNLPFRKFTAGQRSLVYRASIRRSQVLTVLVLLRLKKSFLLRNVLYIQIHFLEFNMLFVIKPCKVQWEVLMKYFYYFLLFHLFLVSLQ